MLSREAKGELLSCSVLGQYDLVATDIPVRGVNLCNKLLTESSVSDVTFSGYGLCGRRPARLVIKSGLFET
jgi:hypothetical protein